MSVAYVLPQTATCPHCGGRLDAEPVRILEVGPLRIDRLRHEVTIRGQSVALTPIQYRALSMLTEHGEEMCSPRDLILAIWGEDETYTNHHLRVHIARLRDRLGRYAWMLQTVPNAGYILTTEPAPEPLPKVPPSERLAAYRHPPDPWSMLGPRQRALMRLLESTPGRRVSVTRAAVHAYGMIHENSRSRIKHSALSLRLPNATVHVQAGPLPDAGWIWLEDREAEP